MWRVRRGESVEKGSGSPEADYTLEKRRERTEGWEGKCPMGICLGRLDFIFKAEKSGGGRGGVVRFTYYTLRNFL